LNYKTFRDGNTESENMHNYTDLYHSAGDDSPRKFTITLQHPLRLVIQFNKTFAPTLNISLSAQ